MQQFMVEYILLNQARVTYYTKWVALPLSTKSVCTLFLCTTNLSCKISLIK